MSALETTVRVNSEKQTLILAGEPVPQRFAFNASATQRPLTLVASPIDDPKLIVHASFEEFSQASSASPQNRVSSDRLADRGGADGAIAAYARTQRLSSGNARIAIIDTYA